MKKKEPYKAPEMWMHLLYVENSFLADSNNDTSNLQDFEEDELMGW